jgi:phosphate transport system protein
MLKHYDREVEQLSRHLLTQTDRIRHNASIVLGFNSGIGDYIDDKTIDVNEVEIEEECLKIIALHQPVADDLRFLTTIIKTNYNFERMGDLLENIHDLQLNPDQIEADLGCEAGAFREFFKTIELSVTEAAAALENKDGELSRKIWKANKEIDRTAYSLIDQFRSRLMREAGTPALLDGLLSIRYAKRIADNSSNVAKEVLYLVTGEIVRHRRREILG